MQFMDFSTLYEILNFSQSSGANSLLIWMHCVDEDQCGSGSPLFSKQHAHHVLDIYILSVVALDETNISGCLHFSIQNIEIS